MSIITTTCRNYARFFKSYFFFLNIVYMCLHELTITLKPALYSLSASEQFKRTSSILFQLFSIYEVSCVAEVTKTHNVHYHCLINIDNIFHKDGLIQKLKKHKEFGRFSFEQVRYEETYMKYMVKDIVITKVLLERDPVVVDFYGIVHKVQNWDEILREEADVNDPDPRGLRLLKEKQKRKF